MKRVLPVLPLILLAACGDLHHPRFTDPYANLTSAGSPYKAMTAAVLLSENAVKSDHFFQVGAKPWGGSQSDVPGEFMGVFQRAFKAAIRIQKLEDAEAINADVIALVDVRGEINWGLKVTAEANLMRPDRAPLDVVRSEARHRGGIGASVPKVVRAAADDLEKAILASAPLLALAKNGRPAKPSAAPRPVVHSDVDEPGFSLPENANAFALVVGVEDYKNLPAAEYASRDAQAMRKHLRALGYPDRNVVFLTGDNATRTGLAKYLQDWLPKRVTPDSSVVFYYSGHGAPDVASGAAFLLPWDGDAAFLQTTAYPVKQLYTDLGKLKAKRVLVALDACFSGAGGRSVLAKGLRPLVTKVEGGFTPPENMAILAAASGDEVTGTIDEQGHGAFTYYLLKALERERAAAPDPVKVYAFLKPKVQDAARLQNRDQTPVLMAH